MSLIEQTLHKEKLRAELARKQRRAPGSPSAPAAPTAARRGDAPVVATSPADPAMQRPLVKGTLDAEKMERFGIITEAKDQAAIRAYKILRTQMLRKLEAEKWKSVAVTAVGVGDGKTVTAINLAISLARDVNTRVALVDLDLQRPAVASYLGLRGATGLESYLAGSASLDQIYHDVGIDRLVVVPTFATLAQSSEMLTSPAMMALLEDLRAQDFIVIFDLPPMLLGDDVLALAPHADSVLLVVGEGTTSRAALEAARSVLQDMNIAGVVLNRSAERDDTAYY